MGPIAEADGYLRIGALVTETDLEQTTVVAERYSAFPGKGNAIAGPLLRYRARICGNVSLGERVIFVNDSSTSC